MMEPRKMEISFLVDRIEAVVYFARPRGPDESHPRSASSEYFDVDGDETIDEIVKRAQEGPQNPLDS